jgi:hypothetical protein
MPSCRESNKPVNLSNRPLSMDCRVKPGNDDMKNPRRDAIAPELLLRHHHASRIVASSREAKRRKAHANHCRAFAE